MKVTQFPTEHIFYRYLTPRWAFMPLSGAGAAIGGGRFNRPSIEALYLSTEPETALAELMQGTTLPVPAILAAYKIQADNIADFSEGFDPNHWDTAWSNWNTDWKYIARVEGKTPPSWVLGDEVVHNGCRGLLFPSTRRVGGTNLVLFHVNLTPGDSVQVHDPNGDLPVDQSSWT